MSTRKQKDNLFSKNFQNPHKLEDCERKKNLRETLRNSKVYENQGKSSSQKNVSTYHDALMRLNTFRVGVMKKEYVRKNLKNLNAPSNEILKYSPSLPNELLPICKPCKRSSQE